MKWERVTSLDTPFAKGGREWRVVGEGERRRDGTWATGLEPVYLDGTFARAKEGQP